MILKIICDYVNENEYNQRAKALANNFWPGVNYNAYDDTRVIEYQFDLNDIENVYMGMHYLTIYFKDETKESIFFRIRDMRVSMLPTEVPDTEEPEKDEE